MSSALVWRVVVDEARPGALNMALDHALALAVGGGEAVLRLYGWTRPTASFGRNEPARGAYSLEAADTLGIDFVRRPTGGRVVLHDEELTYAVVAPDRALGGPREAYLRINEALALALASLGAAVALARTARETPHPSVVPSTLAPSPSALGTLLPLDAGPCFQQPAPGEVTALGRKLVGSAQARIEGALLQHGSILLAGDQARLDRIRASAEPSTPPPEPPADHAPATLREMIGDVDRGMIIDAIARAMHRTFGGEWAPGAYTDAEMQLADRLAAERYGTTEWTWRR